MTASPTSALEALTAMAVVYGGVDSVMLRLVEQARRDGWTWADIGGALGVTRQTAHARYAHLLREGGGEDVEASQ